MLLLSVLLILVLLIMAEAEIAVEILIIVIEDLTESGIIGGGIAEQLAALTEGAEPELTTIIEDAIAGGQTPPEALDTAYDSIFEISSDAADGWAQSMADQGYEFESGNQAEEADFENTDPDGPDSDPDKGDPDSLDCTQNPTGPECEAQTQGKLSRFFEFMKNWGGVIVRVIFYGAAALFLIIGQIARWICQLIRLIKKDCPNQACVDQKCDSALCDASKKLIQFIRQYWIIIASAIVILAGLAAYYFKSSTPITVGIIALLILIALKTIVGNLIATVVCNVSASTCLFQGKPINC